MRAPRWLDLPPAGAAVLALALFGAILAAAGKHPLQAYYDTATYVLASRQGFTELFVRMGPLVMTALAVAIPARVGLFNVGGEGQLYMGALFATGAALYAPLNGPLLLAATILAGFAGGALWALVPALMRIAGVANEAITTLLLNYVAPLAVAYQIFGPWRSPESSSYPQSHRIAEAARLPSLPTTRVHAGLAIAAACLALCVYVFNRTRWGLEMRAIGANRLAAAHLGLPVRTYLVVAMALGGGAAGLAGMAEVSAIQGRLVSEVSPGYGYMGFLVAWLAAGNVSRIVSMALLFAVISAVGDVLQITQRVPYAVVNILMAAILFSVLCVGPGARRR
ncbi:MAG: ABC transporter permease [Betaproteobacteria bacterium]|nr:ABC transporter permease [Betaproteobacteria bacterium]